MRDTVYFTDPFGQKGQSSVAFPLNGNDPKGVMPYFIKKDIESILSLCDADEQFYKSYAITSNMIKNRNNKEVFCSYRGAVIIEIEQQLLESLGLVCTKKEK